MSEHDDDQGRAPEPEAYQALEEELLDSLVGASEETKDQTIVIEMPRKEGRTFWFRIAVVPEDVEDKIRKACQVKERNKRFGGLKMVEDFDNAKFRSLMIINMTEAFIRPVLDEAGDHRRDPVTGKLMWEEAPNMFESKALRSRLKVSGKHEVVDALLLPGEKELVLDKHDELAGHNRDEDTIEEQAKNS